MRYLLLGWLALCLLASVSAQEESCAGFNLPEQPRYGQITAGSANNVRAEASTEAELLGQIPALALVNIVDGAVCDADKVWWPVRYGALEGWTVSHISGEIVMNFVEPLEFEGLTIARFGDSPLMSELTEADTHFPEYILLRAEGVDRSLWRDYFQLRVYFVPALAEISDINADRMSQLRYLLEKRPDLSQQETLPYVGGWGSAQAIRAQAAYVDWPNLVGIRYLTAYTQNTMPFLRDSLMYEFTGFTPDYRHVIHFSYPVIVDALPGEPDVDVFSMDGDEYAAYRGAALAILEQDNVAIDPMLTTLDSVLGTISIEPTTLEVAIASPQRDVIYHLPFAYGACENSAFPSRLEPGMVVTSALPAPYALEAYLMPDDEEPAGWILSVGDIALILDGPACTNGFNHWLVYGERYRGTGWVPESGIFAEDNQERYFLRVMPGSTIAEPPSYDSQAATACELRVALWASIYEIPNSSHDLDGSLIRGVVYYADAYYIPPEGGFEWWHLTAGATIWQSAEEQGVIDSPVWVTAGSVIPGRGCEGTAIVDTP